MPASVRRALAFVLLAGAAAGDPSRLCSDRKKMTAHINRADVIKSWQKLPNVLDARNESGGMHYDPFTRPAVAAAVYNWSVANPHSNERPQLSAKVPAEDVTLELFANSVWDIDQRSGAFQVQAHLTMKWQDDRLCFNPDRLQDVAEMENSDENGKGDYRIQIDETSERANQGQSVQEMLWTPDVHFVNSIKAGDSEEADASLISVTMNGRITWRRRFILALSSDFDFSNLPYDRQVLSIYLESYRLPASAMSITWSDRNTNQHKFGAVGSEIANKNHNPEWCFRLQGDVEECGEEESLEGKQKTGRVWSDAGIIDCQDEDKGYTGDPDTGDLGTVDCISPKDPNNPGKIHKQRAYFRMQVQRQTGMWKSAYITPTMLLLLLSYCGLFIGNHNPGRPSVHCLTILAHLTIDASIRAQIPSISNETWITNFNEGVLYFMVLIFVEYCIVHYAYRQKKKLKRSKHREQEVFLDAVKLQIQMKAMSQEQREALEGLLDAIPNSWLAGSGPVTDKRAKKVQDKLGISDRKLEDLLGDCAKLLRSPEVTASELMSMCYGMGTDSGGSKDEPGDTDMNASMRETLAVWTPSVRDMNAPGVRPFSFSTEASQELLQPGQDTGVSMRESRLGLQRSEAGEPAPPKCSEVVIAFLKSVFCCKKGLGLELAETVPKVKKLTMLVANLTGLDWSARFVLPVAFAIFYYSGSLEGGSSACKTSNILGAKDIGCSGGKWP